MSTLKPKSSIPVTQDERKVEQLSDVAIKERMRPYVPEAIAVVRKLMSSANQAIALGAAKIFINKFIPDLKVTELLGNTERPLGVVILPHLNDNGSTLEPVKPSSSPATAIPFGESNEQSKDNMATPPRPADGSIIQKGI